MRCDADFDGTRPLVHHLVDANLEHLIGAQRPAAQDHAVVKVISGAVKAALLTLVFFTATSIFKFFPDLLF